MPDTPTPINRWFLLRFLKPYTAPTAATLLFLLIGRVASTLDPLWLKKIIDGISQGLTLSALTTIIAAYFGLKVVSAVADFLRDVIFAPAEMGIARTLSDRLFEHLLRLPIRYHHDQRIGGISRQITRGGRAIAFILDFLVINILPTVVELVIVTAFLLMLYPPVYAVLTFLTVIVYTWFTVWATEKRQKFRLAANQADDQVASLEVDALNNIETIKYFNNEPQVHGRYLPAIWNRYKLSTASNQLFALISGVQAIILLVGLGAILLLAIRQTLAGVFTIGDLVLLTTYVVRLSMPIGMLGFVYRQIKDGLADLDGMARILAEENTLPEPAQPATLHSVKGDVVFDRVSFAYTSERQILHDISVHIEPGQSVAFVGPSGAGKSTIVKVLFRLFDPTEGSVLIDGVNLRDLDKDTRASLMAIVPQDPILFNASIAENIRFAKPDATDEEVGNAVRQASLGKLVKHLPEGLQTMVGERGVKLSGGEKQRVAIARAILRNPRILVFDEATSSLDSHSERAIQKALQAVSAGRTTIAIAHRLSTIVHSDCIFVLDKGRIVEQGTHDHLLEKDGVYAHLWQIQSSHDTTVASLVPELEE